MGRPTKKTLIIPLSLLLIGLVYSAEEAYALTAEEHFEKGKQLIDRNCTGCIDRTEEGLQAGAAHMRKAIELGSRKKIEAYKLLARALRRIAYGYNRDRPEVKKALLEEVREIRRKVVELAPKDARAWSAYAAMVDDDAKKLEIYQRIVKLDPEDSDARLQIGILHTKAGDLPSAVPEFKRVIRLVNDVRQLWDDTLKINDAVLSMRKRGFQCDLEWFRGVPNDIDLIFQMHMKGYKDAAKVAVETFKVRAVQGLDKVKCVKPG